MKLSDLHQTLKDIAYNSDEYANNEIEEAINASANLILLLDDWATAKRRIADSVMSDGSMTVVDLRTADATEAALLSACKWGDE